MLNPKLPSELIFFVTSSCPLRCKHCFNWRNLQRNKDLSLAEIEMLASSLPNLNILSVSGGEPFLRKDIGEICRIFATHCNLTLIDIPTSGTLVDTTLSAVEEILRLEPPFNLTIGVSLDGMESYHDSNRGVPGTFAKAVECCKGLLELKKKYKRLSVNILTTLVYGNKEELLVLKEFVAEKLPDVDALSCGIARGDVKEGNLGLVSPKDLTIMDREILEFNKHRSSSQHQAITSKIYELRQEAFLRNVQPVPCVAGRDIAVVYDDGGVAPCELLPPVGNLREAPFSVIWGSGPMREARAAITAGDCACTHECFLGPSYVSYLLDRPLSLVKVEGLYGFFHLLYAKWGLGRIAGVVKKLAVRLRRGH
jgi:MoaA/NifB/PqqE/SkfB family radical SAM enzyme